MTRGHALAAGSGMTRTCIAVVDAAQARLFTLDRTWDASGVHEELSEDRDLVNPARRLRPSELFTESRPPAGRMGNIQYTLDDHRDDHIDEMDAEFSRAITSEVEKLVRSTGAERLIVCASPKMLGKLRNARRTLDARVAIDEVPRNLTQLTPREIREHLELYGLVPERPARPLRF